MTTRWAWHIVTCYWCITLDTLKNAANRSVLCHIAYTFVPTELLLHISLQVLLQLCFCALFVARVEVEFVVRHRWDNHIVHRLLRYG